MKTIIVKTQSELDALPAKFEEYTVIEIRAKPVDLIIVKSAWESSHVVARGSSHVEAWGSSHVVARGSSHVVARGSSHVEAWGSSHVEAWGSSHVEAWESSHVVARGSSHVVARGSSHVVAWGSVACHCHSDYATIELFAYAVVMLVRKAKSLIKHSKTCTVIEPQKSEGLDGWLEDHAIKPNSGKVTVYKRVSKEFKTQEGTPNETLWKPGSTVSHPSWNPKDAECGEGKFHACATTYFCDEFRSERDDRYVAIEVKTKDIHVWKEPSYPHKIAFREGKVLHELNRRGEVVK